MKQAVSSPSGTAHLLNSLPVQIASKTGTAQTSKQNYYHDWVVAFGPYQKPDIVLTVLVENVEGDQTTASLVAKEILEYYFQSSEKK